MLEQLVTHPAYKLVTLRSIPHVSDRSVDYTSYQWPSLLRHLRQMLIAKATMEEGLLTSAALMLFIGRGILSVTEIALNVIAM